MTDIETKLAVILSCLPSGTPFRDQVRQAHDDVLSEISRLQAEVERLRSAICQTLDANGHLADGDVCTLLALKVAMRESGDPWHGDIADVPSIEAAHAMGASVWRQLSSIP